MGAHLVDPALSSKEGSLTAPVPGLDLYSATGPGNISLQDVPFFVRRWRHPVLVGPALLADEAHQIGFGGLVTHARTGACGDLVSRRGPAGPQSMPNMHGVWRAKQVVCLII